MHGTGSMWAAGGMCEGMIFSPAWWCEQEPVQLYGVDVTGSRYLSRPEVLRAAHFAAAAHEGQVGCHIDFHVIYRPFLQNLVSGMCCLRSVQFSHTHTMCLRGLPPCRCYWTPLLGWQCSLAGMLSKAAAGFSPLICHDYACRCA